MSKKRNFFCTIGWLGLFGLISLPIGKVSIWMGRLFADSILSQLYGEKVDSPVLAVVFFSVLCFAEIWSLVILFLGEINNAIKKRKNKEKERLQVFRDDHRKRMDQVEREQEEEIRELEELFGA